MSRRSPKVSVITCFHNGERFLRPAIESILCQEFTDFEFWLVDDCSTDGSRAIAESYLHDDRVKLLVMPHNVGPYAAANLALGRASGEYVVRMDADDVSLPHRLALQVQFLDAHSNVGLLGTSFEMIDEDGALLSGPVRVITGTLQLRWMLLFRNPIVHSTVVFRRSLAVQLGGYGEARYSQDHDLWSRMSFVTDVEQLLISSVQYRLTLTGLTALQSKAQRHYGDEVTLRALARLLGRPPDDAEITAFVERQRRIDRSLPTDLRRDREFIMSLVEPFCRMAGCDDVDRQRVTSLARDHTFWVVYWNENDAPLWALRRYAGLALTGMHRKSALRFFVVLLKLLLGPIRFGAFKSLHHRWRRIEGAAPRQK